MVFTNKHVVIAMIVAPILAVLAWFAAGYFTSEPPQAAVPGQSYPLVEKSNCRYPSGACDLQNEDLRLTLRYREEAAGPELVLVSSHPLDSVVLGIAELEGDDEPAMMRPAGDGGKQWRLAVDARPQRQQRIRLVAVAAGSAWFADAATAFLQAGED